jgi:RNA polymerase sigma-70 factor (ECF subfamily)
LASSEQRLALAAVEAPPPPQPIEAVASAMAPPVCFAEVVREYSAYVLGLLRRLGVAPADVEDVAQEVFLAVHKQLAGFEARSTLKTWLCGICRNKAFDHCRMTSRRRRLLAAAVPHDASAYSCDPQQELLLKERENLLHLALEKLPQDQREVFVLFEIEQLSMKEVAAAVRCELDTAYSRHRVARQRVQAAFERVAKSRKGE